MYSINYKRGPFSAKFIVTSVMSSTFLLFGHTVVLQKSRNHRLKKVNTPDTQCPVKRFSRNRDLVHYPLHQMLGKSANFIIIRGSIIFIPYYKYVRVNVAVAFASPAVTGRLSVLYRA